MNIGIDVISTLAFQHAFQLSFAINNFCLLAIFCSLRGRIPFITILTWFIVFLRASAIEKTPSAIFSKSSVSRFFVPQLITTYSSDCGRGIFSPFHNTFWILSQSIPQFIVFSSNNLYQMLGYLRKPAIMESRSKIADTFFDDLMSAAWFLWFRSQLSS